MALTKSKLELVEWLFDQIEDHMSERDFQRDFMESLKHQYERDHYLTEKQIAALNRIYERVTR